MTEAERIAAGLSEAQRRAMFWLKRGRKTAFDCKSTLATMEGLHKKGLIDRVEYRYSTVSPRACIDWPLTELGRKVLERSNDTD